MAGTGATLKAGAAKTSGAPMQLEVEAVAEQTTAEAPMQLEQTRSEARAQLQQQEEPPTTEPVHQNTHRTGAGGAGIMLAGPGGGISGATLTCLVDFLALFPFIFFKFF